MEIKYFFTPILVCILLNFLITIGTENQIFYILSNYEIARVLDVIHLIVSAIDIFLIILYTLNLNFLKKHTSLLFNLILISGIILTLYSCCCFLIIIIVKKVQLNTFNILCFIIQCVMLITHVTILFKHFYFELKGESI
uniref:7TM GPCR serpentine receptor class x (Srx) domain-containing protein n=1 Tax=Strongyloides stercoralis TaxID=6248 RepID=A0A0K0EKC8_STRER